MRLIEDNIYSTLQNVQGSAYGNNAKTVREISESKVLHLHHESTLSNRRVDDFQGNQQTWH